MVKNIRVPDKNTTLTRPRSTFARVVGFFALSLGGLVALGALSSGDMMVAVVAGGIAVAGAVNLFTDETV